jgi:ABC-type amino acid transport substrate-binding protein
MQRTILTAALLFLTILAILFISINATETRAFESDLELGKKWSGDFDGMAERHLIRALVPYSKTFYFLDGADQRGLVYDLLKEFETYMNKELQRTSLKVRLVVIPTKRDRLLPALVEGLGDIAAGNLTITSVRQKQVDFSAPHLGPLSRPLKPSKTWPERKSTCGHPAATMKASCSCCPALLGIPM